MNYKNKISASIFMIFLVLMGVGLVSATVLFFTSIVSVTVGEPLSSTSSPVSISGYAGESIVRTFVIDNKANAPIPVSMAWSETSNPSAVTYGTDMTKTVIIPAGNGNIINATFLINTGSATGTFNGTVTFTRI